MPTNKCILLCFIIVFYYFFLIITIISFKNVWDYFFNKKIKALLNDLFGSRSLSGAITYQCVERTRSELTQKAPRPWRRKVRDRTWLFHAPLAASEQRAPVDRRHVGGDEKALS